MKPALLSRSPITRLAPANRTASSIACSRLSASTGAAGRCLVIKSLFQLIASTKTETGLTIACDIDWGRYPKGIKIPKAALKALNIKYDDFHGDWNYTISPIADQGAEIPLP
jgi:Rhodopirellula transposase DDE domain